MDAGGWPMERFAELVDERGVGMARLSGPCSVRVLLYLERKVRALHETKEESDERS